MNPQEWLNNLKIALVNDDLELLQDLPRYFVSLVFSKEEQVQALHLLHAVIIHCQNKKNFLSNEMNKIKKTVQYTSSRPSHQLLNLNS